VNHSLLSGGRMGEGTKHNNYEILNLIGYGLAKYDLRFIKQFGFQTKTEFYEDMLTKGVAETIGTIKNRQDLFDPFFDNGRKGWWQKGDAYKHRKILIDSLFGDLNVKLYADVVKLHLESKFGAKEKIAEQTSPILRSKFKQLQKTGQEAELYFIGNYQTIDIFKGGKLEDARLFGDGYDFQIESALKYFLVEVKGVRTKLGSIRFTENEYAKAKEYKNDFALVVVANLTETPKFGIVLNPINNLQFTPKEIKSKQINYHTGNLSW
jgi:hypothetical protein